MILWRPFELAEPEKSRRCILSFLSFNHDRMTFGTKQKFLLYNVILNVVVRMMVGTVNKTQNGGGYFLPEAEPP
jgi:hypothetical protein